MSGGYLSVRSASEVPTNGLHFDFEDPNLSQSEAQQWSFDLPDLDADQMKVAARRSPNRQSEDRRRHAEALTTTVLPF
jgi:hypothetical protein